MPSIDRPTRFRFAVLALLCAMAFVLYLDRVCMGQAVKPISDQFGISKSKMAYILGAFTLAYGLFEVPTGRLGDRLGARRVLARIALWWSLFTMLTAACWGFWSLLAVRFLFGAGEAGAYPNAARVIARWFPAGERGRVQGLLLAAGLIGGTLSQGLAGELIELAGWRFAFVVFGSSGLVWVTVWWFWFRDDPGAHPAVNEAERKLIGTTTTTIHESIPWRAVLRNRTILLLGLIMACTSFVSYVYSSWYSTYLQEARHVEPRDAGWLATLAIGGGALGMLGGGFVVDRLTRGSRSPMRARRWATLICFMMAAGLLALAVRQESPIAAAALTAASCFAMYGQQSAWWSSATEASGPHVGALFGLMNGLGVIGALSSQIFFGRFADWRASLGYVGREQWDPAFDVCVALLLLAGVCWLLIKPSQSSRGT